MTFARSSIAVSLAIVLTASAAAAQQPVAKGDSTSSDSAGARRIVPVVITATRTPTAAGELPQRVMTITRADLERAPVNDAVDALKKLAGVDVVQYPSLLGGIGIRGFRPSTGGVQQRVLVLLDGRPAGTYNLALLDLANVERIEVLKGPASALYGSSAVGGVVNLVTRASRERPGGSLSVAYGTYRRSELTARAGGRLGRLGGIPVDADAWARRYEQGAEYRVGSGTVLRRLVHGSEAVKIYTGTTTPSRAVADTAGAGLLRDHTTYTTRSGGARVGTTLPGRLRIDVRGEGFRADDVLSPGDVYALLSESPGSSRKNVSRRSEDVTLTRDASIIGGATLAHAPLLRAYDALERSENYDQPGAAGFVNFRSAIATSGVQLQDVLRFRGHSLTAGLDGSRIESTSSRYEQSNGGIREIGTFSPDSRLSSVAAFGEAQLRSAGGRLTTTLGARLDRVTLDVLGTPYRPDVTAGSSRFVAFNPHAGLQLALRGGVRAHATVGRGFLAPDAFGTAGFSQAVTSDVASITVGNPALRAEHSTTFDGGLSFVGGRHSELDLDVTAFRTAVEDRITRVRATFAGGQRPTLADGTQVSSISTSVNAGSAHIEGVEAHLSYDVGRALGEPFRLALLADGTRLLRAEEVTPAARVDTTGFGAMRDLDPHRVFSAIVLGPGESTLRIKNVATLTTTLGVDYDDFRRLSARLAGRYVGRRLDTDFADVTDPSDIEYPPFMVLDLTMGVRLGERYRADVQVSNLTDENYYEKRGYNLAGRTVRLRLSATF